MLKRLGKKIFTILNHTLCLTGPINCLCANDIKNGFMCYVNYQNAFDVFQRIGLLTTIYYKSVAMVCASIKTQI